ncbi:hypothetical protein J19TS2_23490 [Cohnella xylanilytica]|nr:hypothetical protein J19TS2_23490 [Cohnella xylanilytica]
MSMYGHRDMVNREEHGDDDNDIEARGELRKNSIIGQAAIVPVKVKIGIIAFNLILVHEYISCFRGVVFKNDKQIALCLALLLEALDFIPIYKKVRKVVGTLDQVIRNGPIGRKILDDSGNSVTGILRIGF